MSEDVKPYGAPALADEPTVEELRALIARTGLSQRRAAEAIDVSERMMRYYASGQEQIPRSVLYALRHLAARMSNPERYLQVHWDKSGHSVLRQDKVRLEDVAGELVISVNGKAAIRGTLEELVERGVVTLHTSDSGDRIRWEPASSSSPSDRVLADLLADLRTATAPLASGKPTLRQVRFTRGELARLFSEGGIRHFRLSDLKGIPGEVLVQVVDQRPPTA